nr:nucleotidyl transferase AbiEii/AbiGii toxin family protein [Nitrosomonas nitrosa]
MAKPIRNMGASVRARLLAISKERNQPFELVLTRYVLERLLYRLTQTKHRERFVLKGAMLITTWFDDPHRPTRDVDLLGFGDPNPEAMIAIFREIAGVAIDDGVEFDATSVRTEQIREDLEYGGLRIRIDATVSGARIGAVIDIGFGDAVEPGLEEAEIPSLLDQPPPRLRSYARETVIAEKFHAMVLFGRANSRLKDYYDIWVLSQAFKFDGDRLSRAIAATFERRKTPIPTDIPDALTPDFAQDAAKQQHWNALLRDAAAKPGSLEVVVAALERFLIPHANRARVLGKSE